MAIAKSTSKHTENIPKTQEQRTPYDRCHRTRTENTSNREHYRRRHLRSRCPAPPACCWSQLLLHQRRPSSLHSATEQPQRSPSWPCWSSCLCETSCPLCVLRTLGLLPGKVKREMVSLLTGGVS